MVANAAPMVIHTIPHASVYPHLHVYKYTHKYVPIYIYREREREREGERERVAFYSSPLSVELIVIISSAVFFHTASCGSSKVREVYPMLTSVTCAVNVQFQRSSWCNLSSRAAPVQF